MKVRSMGASDWPDVQRLYTELTESEEIAGQAAYENVIGHPGTSILGLEYGSRILSMATLHVLPNVSYGGRPYGLVENVVTLGSERGQGFGRRVMTAVVEVARAQNCYKVMLLTGQRRAARGFYEAVGFSADEKWGMIRRL